MKKLFSFVAIFACVMMLTGCGFTSNLSSNVNVVETSVVLSEANFHVVRNVSAEVSSTYVLGIGGISKKALKDVAVAELTKEANLKGSQALINVAVKSNVQSYFIVQKTSFIATGTVIEFEK
jgi:uncharacterized protein YbjQ (UPF0145 family)